MDWNWRHTCFFTEASDSEFSFDILEILFCKDSWNIKNKTVTSSVDFEHYSILG